MNRCVIYCLFNMFDVVSKWNLVFLHVRRCIGRGYGWFFRLDFECKFDGTINRKYEWECKDCPIDCGAREGKFNRTAYKFERIQNQNCDVDADFVNEHVDYAKDNCGNRKYSDKYWCEIGVIVGHTAKIRIVVGSGSENPCINVNRPLKHHFYAVWQTFKHKHNDSNDKCWNHPIQMFYVKFFHIVPPCF